MITPHLPARTTQIHQYISYCLSALLVGMLVLQLYTFDEMADIFAVLLPATISPQFAVVLPALIVIVELAALSYALPLYLSRLARLVTRIATIIVPIFWIALLWLPLARLQAGVYPFFGTKLPLSIDSVSFLPVIVLSIFTAVLVYFDITHRRS